MYHNNIEQYDFSVSDTGELEWKIRVLPIDIKAMTFWLIVQAPVVQKVDSAIHWINHYPVDNPVGFRTNYLGLVPQKMVKFNPGLSWILSKVFFSKNMQLELKKDCWTFTPRYSNDNTKCYSKQYRKEKYKNGTKF